VREVRFQPDFEAWRAKARELLQEGLAPARVAWKSEADSQAELGLFAAEPSQAIAAPETMKRSPALRVPPEFVELAKYASVHRAEDRWDLLYRVLWRLTHGEPNLLKISIDRDVTELASLHRSVRRDLHKMTAFVRFRKVDDTYVAWYRSDHAILPLVAPFFARRFNGMRWTILTDTLSVHWDGSALQFLPGCPRSRAPREDEVESLWKAYYASTFNPARIKLKAMRKEMNLRYWDTMPETALIPDLLRDAPNRLKEFYKNQKPSAKHWFPETPPAEWTLPALAEASQKCRACGICENATQTVFGEGLATAEIALVGEQPGDQEDREGRPFIGPAGKLLDDALAQAGVDRKIAYVTNAVKHFKWTPQGEIRLHMKPSSAEVAACQSWLRAELEIVRPRILVCLGATAAQAILGRSVRLADVRGEFFRSAYCDQTFVTTHPSAILRIEDPEERAREFARFVADLKKIRESSNPS